MRDGTVGRPPQCFASHDGLLPPSGRSTSFTSWAAMPRVRWRFVAFASSSAPGSRIHSAAHSIASRHEELDWRCPDSIERGPPSRDTGRVEEANGEGDEDTGEIDAGVHQVHINGRSVAARSTGSTSAVGRERQSDPLTSRHTVGP